MKKTVICIILTVLMCLCGCSLFSSPEDEPFSAAFTIRTTAKPTEVYFDVPYSESFVFEGATSTYSSDALNFRDLRSLFAASVFTNADDTVHLWQSQIRYCMSGSYTAWDTDAVTSVARDLVSVTRFPGMRETAEKDANVIIRFTQDTQASVSYETDGAGVMRTGTIVIPQRLPNDQRQALIEQSVMQLCGFLHTADTPLDSVLNKDKPASSLTEVDLILLDILYGEIQPEMSRDACLHAFDAHFQTQ